MYFADPIINGSKCVVADVEDTSHLVPWLLGNQIDLNGASRQVLMTDCMTLQTCNRK